MVVVTVQAIILSISIILCLTKIQKKKKNTCFITYTINRGLWVLQSNGKNITYKSARKGERKVVENQIVNL